MDKKQVNQYVCGQGQALSLQKPQTVGDGLAPSRKKQINQYSPLTLAFLGDAVYEQLVRERIVLAANRPVGKLHKAAVLRVRAEYQARAYDSIYDMLSEDELSILKRGRNACGKAPKSSNIADYSRATALEALFGYLYLSGELARVLELFSYIWDNIEIL